MSTSVTTPTSSAASSVAPHAFTTGTVTTGGVFARVLLRLFGLHLRDGEQPLDVTFMPDGSGTIWDRCFGTGPFISRIEAGGIGFLIETFGPVTLRFWLTPDGEAISWGLQRAAVFGLVLPSFLAPHIAAREWLAADKAYAMSVVVALPLLGLDRAVIFIIIQPILSWLISLETPISM